MKEKWSTTCYKGMGLVKVILMRRFYDNDLPTVIHDSILLCAPNTQMILKWNLSRHNPWCTPCYTTTCQYQNFKMHLVSLENHIQCSTLNKRFEAVLNRAVLF
jgi:hypothetical protein